MGAYRSFSAPRAQFGKQSVSASDRRRNEWSFLSGFSLSHALKLAASVQEKTLKLAIFLFLLALIAAVLGYCRLPDTTDGIAKRAYFQFTLLLMIIAIGSATPPSLSHRYIQCQLRLRVTRDA